MTDTSLKIINSTYHDATIQVTVANDHDWPDQHSRPDREGNFQNLVIKVRTAAEFPEKVAIGSSKADFTVTANFTDGSSITFSSQLSDYSTKKVNQCSNGYLVLEDSLIGGLRLTIMPYSRWMGDKMSEIGNRTLRNICLPGSHDAGMSINERGPLLSLDGCFITQRMTIRDQLAMGVRYFDLRVIKGSGKYHTGDYSPFDYAWGLKNLRAGGRGLSLDDIIAQINDFTSYCKSEVIILAVSHSMDTDKDFKPFNQHIWEDFFTQLEDLNDLYTESADDLTQVKLSDFVKSGSSAVVVVLTENPRDLPPSINWREFPGIHQGSTFPMFGEYSNTIYPHEMAENQLNKMADNKTKPDDPVFLLSWTLTQKYFSTLETMIIKHPAAEIDGLAYWANTLLSRILPACSPQSFPNIILLDFLFPDLPILPICHSINTFFAVEDKAAGFVLLCNPKRQAEDGNCYLDAGDGINPYMSNLCYGDYRMWKMKAIYRGGAYFKLINCKRNVPVSASGESTGFLVNEDTQKDLKHWRLYFYPSPLYAYDYANPTFCLMNESYYKQKNAKVYMDSNTGQNHPFVNESPNSPCLPVCDNTASNVWRFDKPLN
eukprot:gene3431-3757_t